MKWSFLLFSSFLCLQAIAQYPATGNKMRLGWQTTGDGLVYRGAIGDTATLDPSGLNNAWMLLDTANGNLYAYRAKAWRLVSGGGGSVSDTLTGEVKGPLDSTYIDTVANIIFTTTTDTTVGVGELKYNDTQGSLIQGLKGGNVTNVIGQQIHQRVTNATGGPLTKGTAVFLHGSQGNRITVRKALATADSTSANTFGIVAESIADNQSGYVITEGLITNMNTNALTEGAAVYLSPTVAGELTTTKPQAPQHTVYIGVCVKQHTGSGELFVKIRNGQELDELHDVRITSPDSSASLYYNASESVWRDTTAAVLTSDTSVFARDFQISGTANRLAMFTGANTVGNSVLFDNGTNVGLGNTSPISGNGGGLTIGSPSTGRGLHLYTSGSGLFMYPTGSSNPSLQMTSSDADSSILYYTYFNYSHKFFTTNVERFRISHTGNVGIATSSPSRPLHVAGTTAIRIPVGTTSDRGTSANGDIRYSTTNANFEWYSGTGWREPVNAARSPAVGLANRFSKFDANGLLDTSAILIQANNRIGIFNSPAAGDSALTVTGGIRATRDMYARRYNVSTFTGQVLSINNYAPAGSPGFNIFMGNGGENLNWANGENASYNIGIGFNSLLSVTTAQGNIGIGVDACRNITSGINNIAIGVSSLANTTIANDNFGLGAGTLFRNTIGSSNTAIGNYALLNGVTASSNTGIGLNALYNNTGNNNVGIGTEVLFYQTAASNNSAFGYQAGSRTNIGSNNETSSNSIYIGYDTRASTSGNQNEIVIGYQGRGNGSNTTTIGNSSTTHTVLQYGETLLGYAASGDVGDYRVQVNGNGYVSNEFRIGYTADQGAYPLQVNGQIFATNATIATSDARLKQDIEPLKSGLKEVLSLNPVTYMFKPDTVNNYPKGKQVGFLAQEIKATVQGDYAGSIVQEAGGYLGVADTKLIPLLVKAIQEQQAQIEALKKEIEALKNK